MARTAIKAKNTTPTPPATTFVERTLEPHELVLSPTIQSAVGIQAWGKFAGEADLAELLKNLRERVDKVQSGDMRPVEAMLYGQAMTLETIFTSLARRATSQEYLKQFQTYLGLALKAQAQCRVTLEALAEIKNPRPVAFVKQTNISGGPQQVNNGMQPAQQAEIGAGGGPTSLHLGCRQPSASVSSIRNPQFPHARARETADVNSELLEERPSRTKP